jgi:hypothetical protein
MRGTALFVILLLAVGTAPAQAHCSRPETEILKFLVTYAPSNFSAINAGVAAPGSYQYNLTPKAEKFCPNVFILEDNAATDKNVEFWFVKTDFGQAGTQDQVFVKIAKSFSAVLKRMGFENKPQGAEYTNGGIKLIWNGPSNVWVTVHGQSDADNYDDEVAQDDKAIVKYNLEIQVGHDVK